MLTLTNGSTGTVGSLPIGTTCTLAETSKPTTANSDLHLGHRDLEPVEHGDHHGQLQQQHGVGHAHRTRSRRSWVRPRTPPTTVAAATLPRTGAPDTIYLLIIALMLMLAGGCFVLAAKVDE